MLLDQILVVCLLLIGSHGNMSPDSKITHSKGPSDAVSLPRGTHPNAGQEVQAQITQDWIPGYKHLYP